jgi:hypothetical protein
MRRLPLTASETAVTELFTPVSGRVGEAGTLSGVRKSTIVEYVYRGA